MILVYIRFWSGMYIMAKWERRMKNKTGIFFNRKSHFSSMMLRRRLVCKSSCQCREFDPHWVCNYSSHVGFRLGFLNSPNPKYTHGLICLCLIMFIAKMSNKKVIILHPHPKHMCIYCLCLSFFLSLSLSLSLTHTHTHTHTHTLSLSLSLSLSMSMFISIDYPVYEFPSSLFNKYFLSCCLFGPFFSLFFSLFFLFFLLAFLSLFACAFLSFSFPFITLIFLSFLQISFLKPVFSLYFFLSFSFFSF